MKLTRYAAGVVLNLVLFFRSSASIDACSNANGFAPDPDCSYFWQCLGAGISTRRPCGTGTYWQQDHGWCGYTCGQDSAAAGGDSAVTSTTVATSTTGQQPTETTTLSPTNFCYTYRRQNGMRNDGSYFWRGFVRSLLACAVRCETSRPRCDAFQVKKELAAWDCFLFQLPSTYSLTPDMNFGFYLHCRV